MTHVDISVFAYIIITTPLNITIIYHILLYLCIYALLIKININITSIEYDFLLYIYDFFLIYLQATNNI